MQKSTHLFLILVVAAAFGAGCIPSNSPSASVTNSGSGFIQVNSPKQEQQPTEGQRRQEEITATLKTNQEYCDKTKSGSKSFYGYLSSERMKTYAGPLDGLKKFKCECDESFECDRGNKCVTKPLGSHCVERPDVAWMCNQGRYEFRQHCHDQQRMTDFCEEQFGYGFLFSGSLDGSLECWNIGKGQRMQLKP